MQDPLKKIDVHHHLIPDFYRATITASKVKTGLGAPMPSWSIEQALQTMDRTGIATALTSISDPGVYFGDIAQAKNLARQCNEYQARLVTDYPTRFGAFATLPLPDIEAALTELNYALDTLHHDGVVLLTNYAGHYQGDASFEPLYAELDRRQAVVFIHPTSSPQQAAPALHIPPFVLDFVFDTTRAVVNLVTNGILQRYPNIRFILPHAGGTVPYLAGRIALAKILVNSQQGILDLNDSAQIKNQFEATTAELQRFYYDTALCGAHPTLASLQALVEPTHILYGSDYVWSPEGISLFNNAELNAYPGFDTAQHSAIAQKNALTLFPRLLVKDYVTL